MTSDIRILSARIRQAGNSGLHGDFTDLIEASIAKLFEELENTDDTATIARQQGGIRALRQLLADSTPRIGEQERK